MAESVCHVGAIEICYETFGDPRDPALLLIMGLGTQMVAWHDEFCAQLADRGFFVIRHDNRDIGRSTHLDGPPVPTPAPALQARPPTRRTRWPTWPTTASACSTTSASSGRTSSARRWAG